MKRILVVGDYQKGSGLTGYILSLYSEAQDFNVSCVSYSGKHELDTVLNNKSWDKFDITPVRASLVKHCYEWMIFFKKHHNDFDIIHFNYSSAWNFWAVLMARKYTDARIVIQSHSAFYSKRPHGLEKIVLDFLNKVGKVIFNRYGNLKVAVSKQAALWMFGQASDVHILRNGIDVSKFKYSMNNRMKIRSANGFTKDDKLLCFVGTLTPLKNPFFTLDLLKKLRKADTCFQLCIFGQGPLLNELKQRTNELNLTDYVHFFGVKTNINEWYSAMDVFVFPSENEGFGYSMLEAQVNGLPALCSTTIPSDVQQTSSAVALPLSDLDLWVNKIRSLEFKRSKKVSDINAGIIQSNGYSIDQTGNFFLRLLSNL
ncbi:glycosyltransferase [Lactiplantibacillus modestisalitolerans]|uniref:Glycosyltransferase n=1 Tax=Lactiplantibacillus modestisalitolerans TaxID=1457219 RepID=A0ABV5WVQ9_9LACO|nr:glycosyltransferase [Lactiplantibacillus modestisalitolerans]